MKKPCVGAFVTSRFVQSATCTIFASMKRHNNRKKLLTTMLMLLAMAVCATAQTTAEGGMQAFRKYLEDGLGVQMTSHNKVKLFFSGHDKFTDMFSHISAARESIHLEYFNFRNDSIALATFDLLGARVADGVEVRAMFDAFGNTSNNQPLKKKHLRAIKAKGIDIVKFDPIRFPWVNHVFTRDHRKIVVIDGRVGYTGGMNIADYYIKGLEDIGAWHDIHMRIEGPAVRHLQDIFLRTWNKETHRHVQGSKYYPEPEAYTDGADRYSMTDASVEERIANIGQQTHYDVEMGIVDRAPGRTSAHMRKAYAAAIDAATESIRIVNPYFVPTRRVRKALKRALKRGVEVEIMVPSKSDIGFTPETAELVAHRLMKRGAKVYLFNGGFHHSKIMMIDNRYCTIGTANLNSRSLRYDYETNAFMFDEGVTDELDAMFTRDMRSSTVMDRQYWKERSAWKKFAGWVGNLLTPFL